MRLKFRFFEKQKFLQPRWRLKLERQWSQPQEEREGLLMTVSWAECGLVYSSALQLAKITFLGGRNVIPGQIKKEKTLDQLSWQQFSHAPLDWNKPDFQIVGSLKSTLTQYLDLQTTTNSISYTCIAIRASAFSKEPGEWHVQCQPEHSVLSDLVCNCVHIAIFASLQVMCYIAVCQLINCLINYIINVCSYTYVLLGANWLQ